MREGKKEGGSKIEKDRKIRESRRGRERVFE